MANKIGGKMKYEPEYQPYLTDDHAWMGLSLSRCVQDILDGAVNRGEIVAMNTNTCMPDYATVKKVCKDYSATSSHSYEDWLDTTMYLILNTKFFQYRIWQPQLEEIGVTFNWRHRVYSKWLPVNRAAFVGLYAILSQPNHTTSAIEFADDKQSC